MKKTLRNFGIVALATTVVCGIAYCVYKMYKVASYYDEDYDLDLLDEDDMQLYDEEEELDNFDDLVKDNIDTVDENSILYSKANGQDWEC